MGRLTNPTKLTWVALNDTAHRVRSAAVAKLSDQTVLGRIAQQDPADEVRETAVAKLADQTLLGEIAINVKQSRSLRVRLAAVRAVTDQTILERIARTAQIVFQDHSDVEVRATAVARLTDQTTLAQIAQDQDGDTHPSVQKAATRTLTDQNLLAQIVLGGPDSVRSTALNTLTDPTLLAQIIGTLDWSEWQYLIVAALRKLTDQSLLAQIARDANCNPEIREVAVRHLTDQPALAQISVNDVDSHVRKAAVQNLITCGGSASQDCLVQHLASWPFDATFAKQILRALTEQGWNPKTKEEQMAVAATVQSPHLSDSADGPTKWETFCQTWPEVISVLVSKWFDRDDETRQLARSLYAAIPVALNPNQFLCGMLLARLDAIENQRAAMGSWFTREQCQDFEEVIIHLVWTKQLELAITRLLLAITNRHTGYRDCSR